MIEKIILGSKSPRRQELIKMLGLPYEIRVQDVEEVYPETIIISEVPEYLSKLKASPLIKDLKQGEALITSDTVVILEDTILGKPKDLAEAKEMLKSLSGKTHAVISGVAITTIDKQISFSHKTLVTFNQLTSEEIDSYVEECKPLDKAGAYGIQEWIGCIGVKKIEGSYLNVVGLPLADIRERLLEF